MRLSRAASALAVASSLFGFAAAFSPAYSTIQSAKVLDASGAPASVLNDDAEKNKGRKSLVVVLPQLGEFDSSEFCEHLIAASDALNDADIDLRVVGIGETKAASEFCAFTGLDREVLRLDPDAELHDALGLNAGPRFSVPDGVSDDVLKFMLGTLPGGAPADESKLRPVATSWLNYLAMCAGIGAPGTLREILRGYFGDYNAPERLRSDEVVKAGFIEIGPGVGPVKMGPLKYSQWFADETGYQRPVELATVRLKNMVEVLTKWDTYVTNTETIDRRGATYLFDENGDALYEYKHRGVLTYSETMARPLTFLSDYIGDEVALNPLGLPDTGGGENKRGRGILKPAGKAMGLLGPVFKAENKLQAQALGAEEADISAAKKKVEDLIEQNGVVVFTYGLSPFSTEALALLDAEGAEYEKVEVGLEWFLLDAEASALRAALLEMTGQSSLPHVFIGGEHVGGMFTSPGEEEGRGGGLAGLKERGELRGKLEGAKKEKEGAREDVLQIA